MKNFKDKVAVITGAASGIGYGLAEHAVKEGMKVVLADIEEPALKEAEQSLKASGADALAVPTDVSRLADIENLAQKTQARFGGVHLLCNNAGVQVESSIGQALWENTLADWQWLLDVNLWGVIYGIKVFMPIMLEQDTECYIVNTSSMAGLIAEPELVIYAVTKAGIIKLSEGLYLQLKRRNSKVGVSVLCPAFVTSRIFEAERNRPSELQNPPDISGTPRQVSVVQQFSKVDRNVIPPDECAKMVFQAVREEKFYILTDRLVDTLFKQLADNILRGHNPEMPHL